MKNCKEYKKVIAIKECSAGNEQVGDMWLQTKSFSPETILRDVIEWAVDTHKSCGGKLILTLDEAEE